MPIGAFCRISYEEERPTIAIAIVAATVSVSIRVAIVAALIAVAILIAIRATSIVVAINISIVVTAVAVAVEVTVLVSCVLIAVNVAIPAHSTIICSVSFCDLVLPAKTCMGSITSSMHAHHCMRQCRPPCPGIATSSMHWDCKTISTAACTITALAPGVPCQTRNTLHRNTAEAAELTLSPL